MEFSEDAPNLLVVRSLPKIVFAAYRLTQALMAAAIAAGAHLRATYYVRAQAWTLCSSCHTELDHVMPYLEVQKEKLREMFETVL